MKLILKLIFVLVIYIALGSSAYSQQNFKSIKEARSEIKEIERSYTEDQTDTKLDSSSNLDDYLKVAAINNPGLKSTFYTWKSDLEKTGYVGSLPDPIIVYGYFIENVETRVGPQNQRLSLRQSFPWFGTLGNKKDISFEMSNVSYKKFQSEFLKLSYQVKSAYYDLYFLGRELEITKANIELLTFWESVARTKYQVALEQHPDVIKAQVELGKLEDRMLTLEDQVKPTIARLYAVLNVSYSITLTIPESINIFEEPAAEKNYIIKILSNNPNLSAIKHMIEKEGKAVQLANKSSLPNFTLGIDYIETGEALNPTMDESGKDPWIASIGINLPIWFGKNNAKKNEAKANKISAEYLLKDKENQLTATAETIIFQHDDALRKIQLYRDGLVPKAEQSLNAAYTSYQAGKADFLNVLDAQRQLLDFQLMLDMSKTNLAKRKAELDMLTGFELNTNQ